MPRAEFEELVQRAIKGQCRDPRASGVVKAHYAAELVGDALTHGTGQWSVQLPTSAPAGLPLGDFNMALTKARWVGGDDGILGALDGKSLGLWVEKPGEFLFDWSLRGTASPGETRFRVLVPACTTGVLELKLPVDQQIVVAKDSALVSGPREGTPLGQRLWRLEFNGRAPLEFTVRGPVEVQRPNPLLLAHLQVKQRISPELAEVDFDYQVEVLHAPVRELVFDCDADLQPLEVSCDSLDLQGWSISAASPSERAGSQALRPFTVVVRLREPFRGKLQGLRLRCLARRPADKTWSSPALRLRQAQLLDESITLVVSPDVQVEEWHSGGFRLVSSTTGSDGTHIVSLVDPAPGFEPSHRPSCRVKTTASEFSTRLDAWWQVSRRNPCWQPTSFMK